MTLRTVTFDDADWQVVPKNPVPEMIESGARVVFAPLPTSRRVYTAMLAAAPEPPVQQPTINVVFRCEDNDVVGTTSHQPIHSVRQEDDGSFTVALDYWPTPTRLPAQPRRPYGTDTMSEYGVIPECDGPKPSAQQTMSRDREVWRAALTLANNICVQASDRYNGDDATQEASAINYCAQRIRDWIAPTDEQFAELLEEAGIGKGESNA